MSNIQDEVLTDEGVGFLLSVSLAHLDYLRRQEELPYCWLSSETRYLKSLVIEWLEHRIRVYMDTKKVKS